MKLNNLLTEHYVTIFDDNEMHHYIDRVWDLIDIAYSPIGGYLGATSKEHLIEKTDLWKMVRRAGGIDAVVMYRSSRGSRKSVGIGHDGTRQGKRDVIGIIKADIKLDRAWSEVSGRSEELKISLGSTAIPNEFVSDILGKEILSYNDDGYHYTRLIGGRPIEKLLVGPQSIISAIDINI